MPGEGVPQPRPAPEPPRRAPLLGPAPGSDARPSQQVQCRFDLGAAFALNKSLKGSRWTQFNGSASLEATHRPATKLLVAVLAIFHVQVFVSSLVVGVRLFDRGHKTWAAMVLTFVMLPQALLAVSSVQKGDMRMAVLSVLALSYYVACFESWQLVDFTKGFSAQSQITALFGSLPLFMQQSYLMLNTHFVAQHCEEAFDRVCTGQCTRLPPQYGASFSRLLCDQSNTKRGDVPVNSTECWAWYAYCVDTCVATEFLAEKQLAEDAFVRMLGDTSAWTLGELRKSSKRRAKAKADFDQVMEEDSTAWSVTGCDPQASTYTQLFAAIDPDLPGSALLSRVRSLRSRVLLMYTQILSLTSSAMSLAGALTLRAVQTDRRTTGGGTRERVYEALGFFGHYIVDICATAGALSFFVSATPCRRRAVILGCIAAVFQVLVHRARSLQQLAWYKRTGWGLAHMFISPLSRLPSAPDLKAPLMRSLLRLRSIAQVMLALIGFWYKSEQDPRGYSAWAVELALCLLIAMAAFAMTFLPGPKAAWSIQWDDMSRDRRVLQYLQSADMRRMWRSWRRWKPLARSQRQAALGAGHTAGPARLASHILAFLDEDATVLGQSDGEEEQEEEDEEAHSAVCPGLPTEATPAGCEVPVAPPPPAEPPESASARAAGAAAAPLEGGAGVPVVVATMTTAGSDLPAAAQVRAAG